MTPSCNLHYGLYKIATPSTLDFLGQIWLNRVTSCDSWKALIKVLEKLDRLSF